MNGVAPLPGSRIVRWVSVGTRGGGPFFRWHLFDLEEEKGQGQDLSALLCLYYLAWEPEDV